MSGRPGTLTTTSAVQLDRAGPRDAELTFRCDRERVLYRGRYMGPFESRLLLNHLRRPDAPDDWFKPCAARLAEELEQAMHAAGYIPQENAQ